jgi:thermitase
MKRWIFALASLTIILALTGMSPTVVSGQGPKILKYVKGKPNYVPGEVMVRFRPGVRGEAIAEPHAVVKGQVLRRFHIVPGLEQVRLPKGMSVEEAVARYQRNPNVLHVHPSYILKEAEIPNDPQFGE